MSSDPFDLSESEISHRLEVAWQQAPEPDLPDLPLSSGVKEGAPRPAAVLIPFLRSKDEWHILYTRRNNLLLEHSGQVAFPGGRMEKEDRDLQTTALREAEEEIGLQPQDVRLLGQMHSFRTVTNYCVTPVVGVMPWPYRLQLFKEEVERAFTIPLRWLADPDNYEIRQQTLSLAYTPLPVIYFRHYDGELLWGASARFTLAVLDALGLKTVLGKS